MIGEAQVWLIYGLAATGLVFISLFTLNLACAPYRIERDGRVTAEAQLLELQAQTGLPSLNRTLSTDQKTRLSILVKADPAAADHLFNLLYFQASAECADFAEDVADAMEMAAVDYMVHTGIAHMHNARESGIKLQVGGSDKLAQAMSAKLYVFFRSEGFEIEQRDLDENQNNTVLLYFARRREHIKA